MSGNPMLDAQIARAVQPQFNPMQAIQQMQRPAIQQVQNPIFGGQIPINFALPQVNQIPFNYQQPTYTPAPFQQAQPAPVMVSSPDMAGDSWGGMFGEAD